MKQKIIYWCSRAIRINENPALELAFDLAIQNNCYLEIHFFILKDFKYANQRNMHFLLSGLLEFSNKLNAYHIPLILSKENPLDYFKQTENIHTVVCEQASLKGMRSIQDKVKELSKLKGFEFYRTNTACVVPIHLTSDKCEYAARTIRPKLLKQYQSFLNQKSSIHLLQQEITERFDQNQFAEVIKDYDHKLPAKITWLKAGEDAALKQLDDFIKEGLNRYHLRNDINAKATSYLSPYLHFGMISPRTIVRKVLASQNDNAEAFIEQVLVRRELAENYCFYQDLYDKCEGAWSWAQKTLREHADDPREKIYRIDELELSQTDDELWNECQRMVYETGYLHGYLRMYWAKQVLYWSTDAQEAIDKLIYLNDTYMLDGRDPNGYVGIMWSIMGVHDRPWFEKEVFGYIRTMSKSGTLKKSKLKLKNDE